MTTDFQELCLPVELNSVVPESALATIPFVPFSGTPIQDIYNSVMQVGSAIMCFIYSFQSFLSHVKV